MWISFENYSFLIVLELQEYVRLNSFIPQVILCRVVLIFSCLLYLGWFSAISFWFLDVYLL